MIYIWVFDQTKRSEAFVICTPLFRVILLYRYFILLHEYCIYVNILLLTCLLSDWKHRTIHINNYLSEIARKIVVYIYRELDSRCVVLTTDIFFFFRINTVKRFFNLNNSWHFLSSKLKRGESNTMRR